MEMEPVLTPDAVRHLMRENRREPLYLDTCLPSAPHCQAFTRAPSYVELVLGHYLQATSTAGNRTRWGDST